MSASILRNQLSAADRELFDLRYLDPTDVDGFGRNVVTKLFKTEDGEGKRALVSIYAAPVESLEIEHSALLERLQDESLRAKLHANDRGIVPGGTTRPFASGVIVHDGDEDFSYMHRTLVLRTSGLVELSLFGLAFRFEAGVNSCEEFARSLLLTSSLSRKTALCGPDE